MHVKTPEYSKATKPHGRHHSITLKHRPRSGPLLQERGEEESVHLFKLICKCNVCPIMSVNDSVCCPDCLVHSNVQLSQRKKGETGREARRPPLSLYLPKMLSYSSSMSSTIWFWYTMWTAMLPVSVSGRSSVGPNTMATLWVVIRLASP